MNKTKYKNLIEAMQDRPLCTDMECILTEILSDGKLCDNCKFYFDNSCITVLGIDLYHKLK